MLLFIAFDFQLSFINTSVYCNCLTLQFVAVMIQLIKYIYTHFCFLLFFINIIFMNIFN